MVNVDHLKSSQTISNHLPIFCAFLYYSLYTNMFVLFCRFVKRTLRQLLCGTAASATKKGLRIFGEDSDCQSNANTKTNLQNQRPEAICFRAYVIPPHELMNLIPGVASIPFPFFLVLSLPFIMRFQELCCQLPWRSLRGSPQFDLSFSI